jgi:hypothetical protein
MNPLIMSTKEAKRLKILSQLDAGQICVEEASQFMGVEIRQTYRLLLRYRTEGDSGVVHRSRGRRSNRGYPAALREKVVHLYRTLYWDYGPTLFSERLEIDHRITVDHETARRWLNASGGAAVQRKKRPHRRKRERRSAIGAMIQFDGSDHDWFEGRGAKCSLLHAIDDASNRIFLRFAFSENTHDVLAALKDYCRRYGIPHALYTDHGSVYYAEQKLTDVGRAMKQLGVEMIYANSPQAKGRVERGNRTHQDRLIKALRRGGISTIAEANRFLEQEYIAAHNEDFADNNGFADIHRSHEGYDLDRIFSFQHVRQVRNDYTITLSGQYVQLVRGIEPLPPPKHFVTVCDFLDGSRHIYWEDRELAFTEVKEKPRQKKKPIVHPKDTHPWRHARPIGRARRYTIEQLCHQ